MIGSKYIWGGYKRCTLTDAIRGIPSKTRLFGGLETRREIDEELQFHIEQQTQANIAAGIAPTSSTTLFRYTRTLTVKGVRR